MTVYILGGGPAGLAVVDGLSKESDLDFVLLERGAQLGGLAQTLNWENHGQHDLGPHKIFTQDETLMSRVESLLSPDDWLTRDKISSIYMNGYFLPYPPSPFSLAKVFGIATFIRMILGYAAARIFSLIGSKSPQTFEDDLIDRLGAPLYEVLFKPIALKLWGDPKNLDVKLSQGRVQTPSLWEVIQRVTGMQKTSQFEALTFRYPRGGLQRLWQAIFKKAQNRGKFLLQHEITEIGVDNGRVSSLSWRNLQTDKKEEIRLKDNDIVVSSLPLGLLTHLMKGGLSSGAGDLIRKTVQLNDLLLVFFKIDYPSLLDESWLFVPDPEVAFHRISEQESFDPDMTPDGSIVCCEIMNNEMRPMSACSDDELIAKAEEGMHRMGYAGFRILDSRVIRLPRSYPVFRPGFEPALKDILSELDGIRNFRTVGRQGAFNYIGTLDAMDIGYGCARWLIAKRQGESNPDWEVERRRTSHYPVLD